MRRFAKKHAGTLSAAAAMLAVAALASVTVSAPAAVPGGGPAVPRTAIDLPGQGEDQDRDTYADGVDLTAGNLLVALDLHALSMPSGEPFVVAGTQDDQGRTGAGAELEWPHVVDVDPLGRSVGSVTWTKASVRTGAWVSTVPASGEDRAIAQTPRLSDQAETPTGTLWPQTLVLDVRDDRTIVSVDLELWDVEARPYDHLASWSLQVDVLEGQVRAQGTWLAPGQPVMLRAAGASIDLGVRLVTGLSPEMQEDIAQRWAPRVLFDSGEAFYPAPGDLLERFHGFYAVPPNLRTWDPSFTNGRDTYRLLLADFNGDRNVDHRDAALMADVLSASPLGRPTLYAHVQTAGSGQVVLQYWFLYLYNFVADGGGADIQALAHDGDREVLQFVFTNETAARNGTPSEVVFGRHYDGTRIRDVTALLHDGTLDVYVAQGSHALYPVPGDDRRLRPALAGFFDRFDGEGRVWTPGNYTVEVLAGQVWHAGYLWGPLTRFGRDLGASSQPLLQHDFRYPYTDPLFWAAALPLRSPADLPGLFGGSA